MDIFYTNNTLYVNMNKEIDIDLIGNLKSRVFGILDDYDIDNIVLSVISRNNPLIDEFINEYHRKYNGKIIVK